MCEYNGCFYVAVCFLQKQQSTQQQQQQQKNTTNLPHTKKEVNLLVVR